MYNANAKQHANNDFAVGNNPVGEHLIATLKSKENIIICNKNKSLKNRKTYFVGGWNVAWYIAKV